MATEGQPHAISELGANSILPSGDPGVNNGGTLTAHSTMPTLQDYEAIFGPAARDIKIDDQKHKRHQRWHLPDVLKGPSVYLTDRVDGLVTDATNSPFTRNILPYVYMDRPDGKIVWNSWSYDEGLASRVPYESATRVLTQTKTKNKGYIVRSGLGIEMEHNFMMSAQGREDFKNQLMQLVGSIQYTNDLDVHIALLEAPSYEAKMREKYHTPEKTTNQLIRQYIDLYGIMQKNPNALDILVVDAQNTLKTWGSPPATFMMCNPALTMQLTMNPERTQYITQGIDGVRRLREGPDLPRYRGLEIIHTRKFTMEAGAPPRDILMRRSRVAEHYRLSGTIGQYKDKMFRFYDQSKDCMFTLSLADLMTRCMLPADIESFLNSSGQDQARPTQTQIPVDSVQGMRISINPLDSPESIKTLTESTPYHKSFCSMQISHGLVDLNQMSIQNDADLVLMNSIGYNSLQSNTSLDNIAGFSSNANLIQWAASKYRQFIKNMKVSSGLSTEAAREATLQLLKSPTLSGDMLKIGAHTIPTKELEEALEEGDKTPWTHEEIANAISILGSITFNAIRSPNMVNFKIPSSASSNPNSFIEACFMRSMLDSTLCNVLLKPVNVPIPLQKSFATSLGVKCMDDEFNDHQHNPFNTFLMLKYMSLCHPSESIKKECSSLLPDDIDTDSVVLSYMNQVFDNMDKNQSFRFDVHQLTNILSNQTQEYLARFNSPTPTALYNLATSTMFLNNKKETMSSMPIFNHNKDSAMREQLTQNGIKLSDKAILGTEFRCYPQPSKGSFNTISSILEQSNSNEYKSIAVQTGPIMQTMHEFMSTHAAQNELLSTFYHSMFRRMFTPVMLYANNMLGHPVIMANENNSGSIRSIKQGRIVSSIGVNNFSAPGLTKTTFSARNEGDREKSRAMVYEVLNRAFHEKRNTDADIKKVIKFFEERLNYNVDDNGTEKDKMDSIRFTLMLVRPNIEHNMLSIIMGRGGTTELGCTFWGQTELACYDDAQHGIWGMSYKYHSRALVINEKNLIRVYDVCFNGYNGGMDSTFLDYTDDYDVEMFKKNTNSIDKPYEGKSIFGMMFADNESNTDTWPNPVIFHDPTLVTDGKDSNGKRIPLCIDPDNLYNVVNNDMQVLRKYRERYVKYLEYLPEFNRLHSMRKTAGLQSKENETNNCVLSFQGDMEILNESGQLLDSVKGSGHLGPSYVGVASIREGKGYRPNGPPILQRII